MSSRSAKSPRIHSRWTAVRQWFREQFAPPPVVEPLQLERLEDRMMLSASPLAGAIDLESFEPTSAPSPDLETLDLLSTAIAELDSDERAVATDEVGSEEVADEPADDSEFSTLTKPTLELVFIDIDAEDFDQLVADLMAQDSSSRRFEVHLLSNARDGIEQITEVLSSRTQVDAIHLVSHGSEGQVNLGNTWLDADSVDHYGDQIAEWNRSLNADADLLFYGCDLASTDNGRQLLDTLGAICDCDVAASDDPTGHAELGGDWELEYANGDVETDVAFRSAVQDDWHSVLAGAPPSVTLFGTISYTEGDGRVLVDSGLLVSDPDDINLQSATVRISMNHTAPEDVLHFTDQLGITGVYNSTAGILSLTGTASVADYQTALRSVEYENTSINPNTASRMINVQVSDGASTGSGNKSASITSVGPLTVDTTADVLDGDTTDLTSLLADKGTDGLVSLREAIVASNNTTGADTFELPAGTYTLTLLGASENGGSTGDLDILDDLTISGADAGSTTIDASGLGATPDRVFQLISGTTTISGVAIVEGDETQGAGIHAAAGTTLNLTDVELRGNDATGSGGGIHAHGTVNLDRVTLSGNSAPDGGALYFGGGGSGTLTNVTISGNTATSDGAAIRTQGTVNITNSTIALNTSTGGAGGIHEQGAGDAVLLNTILAFNTGGNANRAVTSLGGNIDSGNTAGLSQPSDQINTDPLLDPALTNNGGQTKTHALFGGSPAINNGEVAGAPAVDQRGEARDASPDVGAFEAAVTTTSLTAVADTYLNKGIVGDNHGLSTSLVVDKSGGGIGDQRALLEFDISSLPVGATITSATLKLQATANSGAFDINVYEVIEDWDEGTGDGTSGEANWNDRQTGVGWTSAGGEFDNTIIATLNTAAIGQHSWDVTTLVADWYSGAAFNHGLMIGSPELGSETVTYDSREGAVTPILEVSYTTPADSDGDGLWDSEEDSNTDLDGNPATNSGPDTDGDTFANYLDADDDNDGTPTSAENADPNADGDPRDALDDDFDGQPDYLDAPAATASNGTVSFEQKISDTAGGLTATLDDGDTFGRSVTSIGDLDGDSVNEIVVGAFRDDDGGTDRGAVYVLFLNSDGTVKAEQKISDTVGGLTATLADGDSFGRSVTSLGDVDGDGITDIAVSAHNDDDGGADRGAVYILLLNSDGTVKAEQKISDTAGGLSATLDDNDLFGGSVTGVGDLDGDGINDLAVGTPRDDDGGTNRGAVHVLFLNADGTVKSEQKISSTAGGLTATVDDDDRLGGSVAVVGDVDGDGVVDLAVGARQDDDGGADRGAVHVLFMNTDGTVKSEQKISNTAGALTATLDDADRFGNSVAGIGDVDGDGTNDIVVGATFDDDGGTDRGGVYVLFLNSDGTVKSEQKISDTAGGLTTALDNDDRLGTSVSGLGDLNGDGVIDVAVGAFQDDDGGTDRGAIYILQLDTANNSPLITGLGGDLLNYTEQDPATEIEQGTNVTVTDGDSTDFDTGNLTVSITAGGDASEDVLSIRDQGTGVGQIGFDGTNVTYEGTLIGTAAGGSGGMDLVVTFNASADATAADALIENVTYENTDTLSPTTSARTVRFTLDDGDGGTSMAHDATVTVAGLNDPPSVTTTLGSLSYTENDGPVAVDAGLTTSDVDDVNLESATVRIVAGYAMGEDLLAFTDQLGITGSWDAGMATLTLTGTSSVANYQTALRTVTYENTSESPSTATRSINFMVDDGESNGASIRTVNLASVNDTTSLAAIEGAPISYTEGDGPVAITSTVTASDVDDSNLESATIQITANYVSGQDMLAFVDTANISSTWDSGTGTLTLTGTDTVVAYQAALRSVTYENTSATPSTATRTVSVTTDDGDDPSNTVTRDITVAAVNTPPVLSSIEPGPLGYSEGDGPRAITTSILVGDLDDTMIESATISITGNYSLGQDELSFADTPQITGVWTVATGTLTLTGADTLANYRTALTNVQYENTSEDPSVATRTVSFTIDDGDDTSNTVTRDIAITPINDAPTLTNLNTDTLTYNAGAGALIIEQGADATVADVDSSDFDGGDLTVSIVSGGAPAEDVLSIKDEGMGPGDIGFDGTNVYFSGSLIGTASGGTTGSPLVVSFNTSATPTAANALVKAVTYENLDAATPTTGSRTVRFTVDDGDGDTSVNHDVTVSVSSSNLVVDTTSDVSDGDTSSIAALQASKGTDGFISLREAIIAANNTANSGSPDEIHFNIAGAGPHTISVTSALPVITEAVIIDGTTEPDFSGAPVIVLDGSGAGGSASGLRLTAGSDGSTIRGLVINQFGNDGIRITGSDNNTIVGNYIGTDDTGMVDLGNTEDGINVTNSANNVIGGTAAADGNIIAGNNDEGIEIDGSTSSGNQILGNLIGVAADGTTALVNKEGIWVEDAPNTIIGGAAAGAENVIGALNSGILISGDDATGTIVRGNYIGTDATGTLDFGGAYYGILTYNTDSVPLSPIGDPSNSIIGGINPGEGNTIAFWAQDGVNIGYGTGHSVRGNAIYSNGELGIDLTFDDDVTANDADDSDTGANNQQNYPVLTSATVSGSDLAVTGSLTSTPATAFDFDFFASTSADPSGHGEAKRYIGSALGISTDALGNLTLSELLTGTSVSAGEFITATATDQYGNTSELALNIVAIAGDVSPPALVNNNGSTALEGGTDSIGAGELQYSDAQPASSITYTVMFDPTNGQLELTTSPGASISSFTQADIDGGLLVYVHDGSETTSDGFNFDVDDGLGNTVTGQAFSFTVTAQNDAPVITTSVGTLGYTENDAPSAIDSALTVADVDDVNLEGASVRIVTGYASGEDVLAFTDQLGITGIWDAGTGILTLSGTSTVANYETALRTVTYENISESPDTAPRTVTFEVDDGASNASDSRAINVTAVNDPSSLAAIEATPVSYTEGDGKVAITSTVTVTDVDDANLESATVQITGNYASGEDLLAFTNTANITGVWDSGTGTLTLTGTDTTTAYEAALRSVTYENTSDDPSTATRTISFTVNDGDAPSNVATRDINVAAINDPTTLAAMEGTPLGYAEGDGPSAITSALAVTDADDVNIEAATVRIMGNYASGEDLLAFTNTASITGVWNAATGTLTLTGTDTTASYQAALRSVTYENTSPTPSTLLRTISFSTNDGDDPSNTVTRDIAVTASNSPPAITTSGGPLSYTENDAATPVDAGLTVADVDDVNLVGAAVRIVAGYVGGQDVLAFTDQLGITGVWDATTGTLALSGTSSVANYEAALRTVTYANSSESPNATPRTVVFEVDDGASNSSSPRVINVVPVNDASVLSAIEVAPLAYTEGDGTVAVTSSVTIADVDDSAIESATVQIIGNYLSGEDSLAFADTANISGSWDAATGTLTLTGTDSIAAYQAALRSVTYENTSSAPSTLTRTIQLHTHDGDDPSNFITRNVAITPVNDSPIATGETYTSYGNTLSVPADGVLANDVDADLDGLTAILLSGPAHGSLALGSDGSFTYTPAVGFSGTDSFTYEATDGTATSSAIVTLNVISAAPLPPPELPPPPPEQEGEPEAESNVETEPEQESEPAETTLPNDEPPPIVVPQADADATVAGTIPAPPEQAEPTESNASGELFFLPTERQDDAQSTSTQRQHELTPKRPANHHAAEPGEDVRIQPGTHSVAMFTRPFLAGLDEVDREVRDDVHFETVVASSALAATTSLSVGYVVWLIRGGVLVSTLLSSMPAWRLIDPMPVLGYLDETGAEDMPDEDSLEDLIRKGQRDAEAREKASVSG